jgi:phosphopentomutase
MPRAIILLLDSLGIGSADDAAKYGDSGANTFLHIVEHCQAAKRNLYLPNLTRFGLYAAAQLSAGEQVIAAAELLEAKYGFAQELSFGKDTPSGHWEMMGVPVLYDWGYFPPNYPSFPQQLLDHLIKKARLPGILGNCHASGTEIIAKLGEEHLRTGKPIVYTSADSVFQIAAHEATFGLERLYMTCDIARQLVDTLQICRVIARPFLGEPGHFFRTGNRRDYTMPPPAPTLLDHLQEAGGKVIAIGKIADIFAHQGITQAIKADGNMAIFDATLAAIVAAKDQCLIFANFVDFDSCYGHRRDVIGYARALELFDARLPELEALLQSDDIVVITADHGCDPTWPGSDHTREFIPILAFGPGIQPAAIGRRSTFADVGQSLAQHFGLKSLAFGTSFLN